jgi:predicted metal-dependent peptidase
MSDKEKLTSLSGEVLRFSRNTILVNLRFLDAALSRLKPVETQEITFGTDGRYLAFEPKYLLKRYAENSNLTVRDYLHTVLHCVFRHNFVDPNIDRELWDLSCDIAVESIINSFDLKAVNVPAMDTQKKESASLEKTAGMLTAEKLYRYFSENRPPQTRLDFLSELFHADDHRLWYMTDDERTAAGVGKGSSGNDDRSENKDVSGNDPNDKDQNNCAEGSEQDWKEISERIQVDMETLSKKQGSRAGSLLQGLMEVNRERYDYTAFLKKFAVMGEVMKVNDDEFDYVFYTYGLKLYKNMPLIEPLEYKEVKRIREFVIAIDTSGSVSGELVQTFLKKTYNIMQETESFFSRINLHIIQCDAEIQEHIKITSQEEFDCYLDTMVIHGLGGTDFRPVFDIVNGLIAQKEFSNLKGLIYFTDGYGTFPAKKPPFETAFVFIDEAMNNPTVPPWAIKLILQKDEI